MKTLKDTMASLSEFIKNSTLNQVEELENLQIFDYPLWGVAMADDPLFLKLKDPSVVGEHHLTPKEWLPGAKAVISYFLPFSSRVRESNYANDDRPSIEWLYGRIEGEVLNNAVKNKLAEKIKGLGGNVIIPAFDPRINTINNRSNWSERHVAYIAGLGTFSLSKSLITQKGCAGRFGSVITDLPVEPTERKYKDIYEYCSQCGVCIDRCPVLAITQDGKEHSPCDKFISNTKILYNPRYGCGKCQTAVPCESEIPV